MIYGALVQFGHYMTGPLEAIPFGEVHVRYSIQSHAPNEFCACAICFGMLHVDPTYSQKCRDRTHRVPKREYCMLA